MLKSRRDLSKPEVPLSFMNFQVRPNRLMVVTGSGIGQNKLSVLDAPES